jgi:2-iminobutanoate/2-iminopropanoate deaminase
VKRLALSFVVGAAATFAVTLPASAQDQRIVHQPSARTPFSAAVQVGDTYWLSGKLGATDETRAMSEGRVAAETHNIMRAFGDLLDELGMDFGDIVRGTVYLADIDGYAEMNEAYAEYFESGNAPSRVTVAVGGLVAGAAIEISFIAVKTD